MLRALVALYGIGLLAAFNPCSLPLYPVFIAAWAGGGRRPSIGASAFVAGSTVSFVGLGLAAGSLGGALQVVGWLGRLAGAWLAIAGMVVLVRSWRGRSGGTWRPLERGAVAGGGLGGASLAGRAFALGGAAGLSWSPCVGPLLGSALTVAGSSGSPVRSALLLAAYAVGTGTPLLLLAHGAVGIAALRSVTTRVARAGSSLGAVIMVVVGVLVALDRYTVVVTQWLPT